ncbi:PAS domain S-box protein [Natrinema longum]|uniref:PAS domain S-box protein n=1 Tax=Natrinema longum TaxID=370324 RepID=UPI001CC9DDEB|nr:PAS domain S-box protein [Natrinema longum]MBZ6497044.1 PAS domain S-box protein [Natrinema longum]
MSQFPQTDTQTISPYYDSGYEDQRDEIEAALDHLSSETDITFDSLRHIEAFAPDTTATDGSSAVVFATTVDAVPSRLEQATVWVTPDLQAAGDAIRAGALDAITWRPGAELELLGAKLPRLLSAPAKPGPNESVEADLGDGDAALRAVEQIDDAILELDTDDRITYLNSAAAALFDRARETLLTVPVWRVLSEWTTDDVREAVERARTTEEVLSTEVSTRDGRWFDVTLYPHDGRLSVYVREITARRESETDQAMYEYLIETVGDAVYILDDEGRFTFVNDALCEMAGYDREELLGSSVHRIKDDETVERAEDALRELRREYDGPKTGEMPIAKLDVDLVTKDGDRLPCTDRMTLRPLENGSFTGTVGTLRDISRQRRRERILNNLLRATQDMVAAETPTDVAERVVDVAMNTIETTGAVVREHDPATDELVPIAVPETVREQLGDRPRYDADEGPVGTAFTENRVVKVDALEHIDTTSIDAGTYLPIGENRTLSVGHDDGDGFTRDERQFLELLTTTAESVFERVERDQERRRYEAVVENANDLLFTLDADGAVTLVTESFAAMLGTTRSALVGTRIADVLADETVAEQLTAGTDGSYVTETGFLTDEGLEIPTRISVAPLEDPDGDGVVVTVQDIRELRMAKQEASRQRRRFTELFGTLTDPLVELAFEDTGTEITTANDRFLDLVAVDEDELRDARLDAISDAIPAAVEDALAEIHETRAAVEREVRVQTDGGVRFYLLRSVPYQHDDGERAFVVLTDITEVKQQGTHLRVLHRLLRHNLRNQTTVIHGRAELIRAATDDEEIASHAAVIEAAGRSLVDASETAQSIQRILQTDHVDPDSLSPPELAAQLRGVVESVTSDVAVEIDVSTTNSVPYDDSIGNAVSELLENAIEYGTPDDGSTIEISVTDRSDASVRIAVSDDGHGIPEEEWSVVAGDGEITQLRHGSGLGLWLAKWVADRHGGSLRLVSAGVDGTTIAIDLPPE